MSRSTDRLLDVEDCAALDVTPKRRVADSPDAGKESSAAAMPCPACGVHGAGKGKTLNVAAQHSAYFPHDPHLREQLVSETAATVDTYDLMTCAGCGLTFAWPMLAPSSTWYQLAYHALDVKPEPRWEFDLVLRYLDAHSVVHEIGCGAGMFLKMCKQRGIPAFGIDFSPYSVDMCSAQGLNAATTDIRMQEIRHPSGLASDVVSFHVLEHLDCPSDLFRHASAMGTPDARLWVSVPSNIRVGRALNLREPFDEPPHHLTRWTEAALRKSGILNGWRLIRLWYQPFSWRSGLWSVASHYAIYERLQAKNKLRSSILERAVRAALYPTAFVQLLRCRRDLMSGMSMIAEYERVRSRSQSG